MNNIGVRNCANSPCNTYFLFSKYLVYFLLLFDINNSFGECSSIECKKRRRFPKLLGGDNADTVIEGIDIDQDSNLILAGKSSDNDLMSSSMNAFVAYYPNTGLDYKWAKQLPDIT